MWGGGARNSALSLIYFIVQKRYKDNQEQVNGDYFSKSLGGPFMAPEFALATPALQKSLLKIAIA